MNDAFARAAIAPAELAALLPAADLRVVDASWHFPASGRDAAAEFEAGHVPGAVHADLDALAAPDAEFAHTLPAAAHFARRMGALGVDEGDRVVVYDVDGIGSAPRLWWLLRHFGQRDVAVLDGGLARWRREGRSLATGKAAIKPATYGVRAPRHCVATLAEVASAVEGGLQIVDARPAGRFDGTQPEPRPELRRGPIPGSVNLPSARLLDDAGQSLPLPALRELFVRAGVDVAAPTIVTCGSGVSACSLAWALHRLGNDAVGVYDGSWTEWATRFPTADAEPKRLRRPTATLESR